MSMSVALNERNVTSEIAHLIEKGLSANTSLPELRREAFKTFQRLGLPENKAEEYKDTPIARILQKNFKFQPSYVRGKVNPKNFHIPDLDANVIIFINGFFSTEYSTIISPEDEVSIITLKDALIEKNP